LFIPIFAAIFGVTAGRKRRQFCRSAAIGGVQRQYMQGHRPQGSGNKHDYWQEYQMAGDRATVARMRTGIDGLDRILNGGLLSGGTYLICGEPGTGKTVLASQLCFHAAASGRTALYVTLLAESGERLLAHQRSLRFFDAALVPDRVGYLSGYRVLEESGTDGFLHMLSHSLKARSADVLVIDAMNALEDLIDSPRQLKKLIRSLAAVASMCGTTTFLLSSADEHAGSSERMMVDGIIALSRSTAASVQAVRELEVLKFRGSEHVSGKHVFTITQAGISVYPRTESLPTAAPPNAIEQALDRRAFGIDGLDDMLNGGVPAGSITGMIGSTGSGRTLLGLHFLAAGAERNERSLYFGFYETPANVRRKAACIGLDLTAHCQNGTLDIIWQPPLEEPVDLLADRLLRAIHAQGTERLFIDGVDAFKQAALYPERLPKFFAALSNELRRLNVTTLTSEEIGPFGTEMPISAGLFSASYENVILTRQVELRSQLHRFLAVLKVRDSHYDTRLRGFEITERGIRVQGSFDAAESLVGGIGHSAKPGR
jgi:circadian clock protein KaiC